MTMLYVVLGTVLLGGVCCQEGFIPGETRRTTQPSQINANPTVCRADEDCSSHSKCVNQVCSCEDGYVSDNQNIECYKVTTDINDTCYISEQCSSFADELVCIDSHCKCPVLKHFDIRSSRCILTKGMGDPCETDSECFLPDDGYNQHIVCLDKKCACGGGSKASDDDKHCTGGAEMLLFSFSTVLFIVVSRII